MKTKEINKLKKMVKEIKQGIKDLGYENVTKACDSLENEIDAIQFIEIFRN